MLHFSVVTNYNCSFGKFSIFRGVHLSVHTYDTIVPGLWLHWISSNASTCFTESGFGTFRTAVLAPLAGILLLLIHLEYSWLQSVSSLWTQGIPSFPGLAGQ